MTLVVKKEEKPIHRAIIEVPIVKSVLHALQVYGISPVTFTKVSPMSWDIFAKDRQTYRLEMQK